MDDKLKVYFRDLQDLLGVPRAPDTPIGSISICDESYVSEQGDEGSTWLNEMITEFDIELGNMQKLGLVDFNKKIRRHSYSDMFEEYIYKHHRSDVTISRRALLIDYVEKQREIEFIMMDH
jgi:hypothetical protein